MGKVHNAWVSPTGQLFEVYGFAQHNQWATEYLEKEWVKTGKVKYSWDVLPELEKEWGCYPYEVLEKLGWVRILDWQTKSGVEFLYQKQPNEKQLKVLFDYCSENNLPLPKGLF